MKRILKNSALIGSTELALILVAIVRAKYLAVSIGPAGYGEYSLLNSFFAVLTAICGGWIARGTIKYTAEYKQKNNIEAVARVHNISVSIVLFLGTLTFFIVIIFSEFIRFKFLSPQIIFWNYTLFAASFLVSSLTPFYGWLLQGFLMVKKTVLLRTYTTLFNFVSIFVFVYLFELTGYFISILISALFSLYLYWRETKKLVPTKLILPELKDEIMIKLMKFGGVNFFLIVFTNISDYIQRVLVLSALNISSVGLFQVINSILSYMGILNRGSLFSHDPKMSQELSLDERNSEFNSFIRFNLLFGIPIGLIVILYSGELITILYSKEFNSLTSAVFFFVCAQIIQFVLGGIHSVMLGKALLKMHSFVSILSSLIIIAISFFFVKKYGLSAIGFSMIVANLSTFLIDYFYLKHKIGILLKSEVVLLSNIAIIIISFSYWVQDLNFFIRTIFLVTSLLILAMTLSKIERSKLKFMIVARIRKKDSK